MTPEKLKLLAEIISPDWMKIEILDWKHHYYRQAYPDVKIPCCPYVRRNGLEFNPESNPAQREEVLLWLADEGWEFGKAGTEFYFIKHVDIMFENEDYTTALMMAAERELG